MFKGAIPTGVRAIVSEITKDWKTNAVYVGCSGNFTIERVLADAGFELHSNDVSLYSCVLGWYFAGQPIPIKLTAEKREEWAWLEGYLDSPEATVATVMLLTRILEGRPDNAYYERMKRAYLDRFDNLHRKTEETVLQNHLKVASFVAGDVVDWLKMIPNKIGFISYPPFYMSGYERMFRNLDLMFDWPRPNYEIFDDERKKMMMERVRDKKFWMLGVNEPIHGWKEFLRSRAMTSNRGVPIYVYCDTGPRRVVNPHQHLEPIMNEYLRPGEEVGNEMKIAMLTASQFAHLRAKYLNPKIKPANVKAPFGVLVDGKLIGAFAFGVGPSYQKYKVEMQGPHIYLLSDFPVSESDSRRLSKLVLYAVLSKETKLLAERRIRRRVRSVRTTVFARNEVSMKYRSLFRLLSRKKPENDPDFKFMLTYGAEMGQWTLNEGLKQWKERFEKLVPFVLNGQATGEAIAWCAMALKKNPKWIEYAPEDRRAFFRQRVIG